MRFDSLSDAARSIWAKSAEPSGHGLLAHMLDVSAVAERLLTLESPQTLAWAADAFGLPTGAATRWLAAMVGLHDLGKATPGFQAKWTPGKEADAAAGLTFHAAELIHDQHDLSSAVELKRLLMSIAGSAPRSAAVAGAVAAHHGHFFESSTVTHARRPGEGAAWQHARRELFDAYVATVVPAAASGHDDIALPALAWLAGLTSVCDWIASNAEWFSPGERDATLAGHRQRALALADAALRAIGWPAHSPLLQANESVDVLVARIVGQPGLTARPLQAAAGRLIEGTTGPKLLIVEAPMGEGKTELALLAHLGLQAALGHRGLFIGLPTQATGNAMFAHAALPAGIRQRHPAGHRARARRCSGTRCPAAPARNPRRTRRPGALVGVVLAAAPAVDLALRRRHAGSGLAGHAQRQAPLRAPVGSGKPCRGA